MRLRAVSRTEQNRKFRAKTCKRRGCPHRPLNPHFSRAKGSTPRSPVASRAVLLASRGVFAHHGSVFEPRRAAEQLGVHGWALACHPRCCRRHCCVRSIQARRPLFKVCYWARLDRTSCTGVFGTIEKDSDRRCVPCVVWLWQVFHRTSLSCEHGRRLRVASGLACQSENRPQLQETEADHEERRPAHRPPSWRW